MVEKGKAEEVVVAEAGEVVLEEEMEAEEAEAEAEAEEGEEEEEEAEEVPGQKVMV